MKRRVSETTRGVGNRSQLQSLAMIGVFDIMGPLVAYSLLRAHGLSTVLALVVSGVFPAFGVLITSVRDRRLDAIGALVLIGIAVGTVLGLLSDNARQVLLEGSVPTAVFGVVCLGSLWSSRPLIFRFAHEFIGEDTPKGRDFARRWQYPGFRRVFRVMTLVWGSAYLTEATVRIVIVEATSASTALVISKVMPLAVAGVLAVWTILYGRRVKRKRERLEAAAQAETTESQPTECSEAPPN